MSIRNRLKSLLLVLLCVMLWALIPVVAKLGQKSLDHHQFLFWSSLTSFSVLLVTLIFKGELPIYRDYRLREWGFFSFLGLLGTYIYYLFLYFGYARGQGLQVLVIQYTWPLFVALLSIAILREPLGLRKVLALGLGFLGVTVVLTRGQFDRLQVADPGVVGLVASGAFCFGLFSVLSKRIHRGALQVTTLYFFTATVASLVSMLALSSFALPARDTLPPVLLNGTLVNGFSYLFWIHALKMAEASYLAPWVFLTPVLSSLYLILFFEESFTAAYGIGIVCVVLAGIINSRS